MLTIQPLTVAMPVPVNIVPLQQNRYSPERLNNTTLVGLLSSCRQALKTLTVKLQLAVLPEVSVAVQVTVVVPAGKIEPDGGTQATVTPGQLSEAVGAGNVTAVVVESGQVCAATAVTLAGHVIVGGCTSLTVTVNEQLGPAVLVQVTVVVPTGKNEPAAGEQVTVPHGPDVVGAG
jgi:hypothetical protein